MRLPQRAADQTFWSRAGACAAQPARSTLDDVGGGRLCFGPQLGSHGGLSGSSHFGWHDPPPPRDLADRVWLGATPAAGDAWMDMTCVHGVIMPPGRRRCAGRHSLCLEGDGRAGAPADDCLWAGRHERAFYGDDGMWVWSGTEKSRILAVRSAWAGDCGRAAVSRWRRAYQAPAVVGRRVE